MVLTNGDVDHVAGLLSLREGFAFTLYASQRVLDALAANSIFNVLSPAPRARGSRFRSTSASSWPGRLAIEAYRRAGQGRALPRRHAAADRSARARATASASRSAIRRPAPHSTTSQAAPAVDATLAPRLRGARLVLFDGTLYTDEEMIAQGLSDKTGRRMGHISMSGAQGSMAAFAALGVERRIYVHINNSNPVLREDSPERAEVERAGWEIAFDGMEIRL